jgi:hypothetical protein
MFDAPVAHDAVSGDLTAVCKPPSGSTFAVGMTTVLCVMTDAAGNMVESMFNVLVSDTTAPVLSLPTADIIEHATSPAGNVITFSASATDLVDGSVTVVCVPPSGSLFGITTTTVNCLATDATGNTTTGSFLVTVLNNAPECQAEPTIAELWPPNHRMEQIGIIGVTDPEGDPVTVTITGIYQDEPTNTVGDGNTSSDASGVGTSTAFVRAERSGTPRVPADGRVYHIYFTGSDDRGGSCTGEVTVGVPHDQGRGRVPVDGGPLYNSVTGAPGAP